MPGDIVLGAGITGLTIGIVSGLSVYEASSTPGGICMSYHVDGYRFEKGGGHWIFGGGEGLSFIERYAEMGRYQRIAGIYFPDQNTIVPYPIQAHKDKVPEVRVTKDYHCPPDGMGAWMLDSFGADLCNAFFFPFNDKYTDGLWRHIAMQDTYKAPTAKSGYTGYNAVFSYPVDGLDTMILAMEQDCDVRYNKKVVAIYVDKKIVLFSDGTVIGYDNLYSTIPLNQMMLMTELSVGVRPDPHTPVSVLNIGGIKGARCPDAHWLYIAQPDIPFHRVGIYSNVDTSFVPDEGCVSFCVESTHHFSSIATIVAMLQDWEFVEDVSVVTSLTKIDVAYTWRWCNSDWRLKSLELLEQHGIHQRGRYGRWKFQGIAASVMEGLHYKEA